VDTESEGADFLNHSSAAIANFARLAMRNDPPRILRAPAHSTQARARFFAFSEG
jgi:hypothetical protein